MIQITLNFSKPQTLRWQGYLKKLIDMWYPGGGEGRWGEVTAIFFNFAPGCQNNNSLGPQVGYLLDMPLSLY